MNIKVWKVAAIVGLLSLVGAMIAIFRPVREPLMLNFPRGKLENVSYFEQGGNITEVRNFLIPNTTPEEVRVVADQLMKEDKSATYGVGYNFNEKKVTVFRIGPASRLSYFSEWARSGGKTKLYSGPVVVGP